MLGRDVLPEQLPSLWTQFLPGSSISVLCAAPCPLSSPSLEASLDLRWGLILAIALPGKKNPMGNAQESGPAHGAHAGVSTGKLIFLTSLGSVP